MRKVEDEVVTILLFVDWIAHIAGPVLEPVADDVVGAHLGVLVLIARRGQHDIDALTTV